MDRERNPLESATTLEKSDEEEEEKKKWEMVRHYNSGEGLPRQLEQKMAPPRSLKLKLSSQVLALFSPVLWPW